MRSIERILEGQRAWFAAGRTLPPAARLRALRRLRAAIRAMEPQILAALEKDLGKRPFEGYMTEVGMVLDELSYLIRHLPRWVRDEPVPTPLAHFRARSFISPQPYGAALVMSPWNYPFQLSINPLAGAIAAGNTVVLKPSAYAPATSAVLKRLVEACFPAGLAVVVEGGREENTRLLEQRFDTIFFTGSVAVGKRVMEQAARHLTPVTLELGGKSPCIVDETADIEVAGRRIAFGKFLNAGQTCVAPDYLLVQRRVKDALVAAIHRAVVGFFGPQPLKSPELPKIVNRKHFDRLKGLMAGERLLFGGGDDGQGRIAPTLLDEPHPDSPVMQQEIFGPILPVLVYDELEEAIRFVNGREKPLALYLFTTSQAAERRVLSRCSFGGGCVNDTVVHLASSHLPFGGVGGSGMGAYHGYQSFLAFTHRRSILKKHNHPDLPVRYHPYAKWKEMVLRALMR